MVQPIVEEGRWEARRRGGRQQQEFEAGTSPRLCKIDKKGSPNEIAISTTFMHMSYKNCEVLQKKCHQNPEQAINKKRRGQGEVWRKKTEHRQGNEWRDSIYNVRKCDSAVC